MLVLEDGYSALALLEDADNLLVQPPGRIVCLPFEVGLISRVLRQDNTINRSSLPPSVRASRTLLKIEVRFDLQSFCPSPLS